MLTSKKVLIYEIIGTAFIIFLGSALHFAYEFSGRFAFVGFFLSSERIRLGAPKASVLAFPHLGTHRMLTR